MSQRRLVWSSSTPSSNEKATGAIELAKSISSALLRIAVSIVGDTPKFFGRMTLTLPTCRVPAEVYAKGYFDEPEAVDIWRSLPH